MFDCVFVTFTSGVALDCIDSLSLHSYLLLIIFQRSLFKIISHFKKIGYNINVLQQTACLVVNPITVGNVALGTTL